MSYDIDVATSKRIPWSLVSAYLRRQKLKSSGSFSTSDALLTISRLVEGEDEYVFDLSVPQEAEPGDLLRDFPQFSGVVHGPRWLLGIGVSGFDDDGIREAIAFGRYLARHCAGAVHDGQAGGVIWPIGKREVRRPRRRVVRIPLLAMDWYATTSRVTPGYARAFLDALRAAYPEAIPRRYGTSNPLRTLRNGEENLFFKAWSRESHDDLGGLLFFESNTPCFGGFAAFAPYAKAQRPARDIPRLHVQLEFDGRNLSGDSEECDRIVALFAEVSRRLGAFYGQGYVVRNALYMDHELRQDERTERHQCPPGQSWYGVPPDPVWIGWYGAPYRRQAERHFSPKYRNGFPDGILVRMGALPKDRQQLRRTFPSLPKGILARWTDKFDVRRARFIPSLE